MVCEKKYCAICNKNKNKNKVVSTIDVAVKVTETDLYKVSFDGNIEVNVGDKYFIGVPLSVKNDRELFINQMKLIFNNNLTQRQLDIYDCVYKYFKKDINRQDAYKKIENILGREILYDDVSTFNKILKMLKDNEKNLQVKSDEQTSESTRGKIREEDINTIELSIGRKLTPEEIGRANNIFNTLIKNIGPEENITEEKIKELSLKELEKALGRSLTQEDIKHFDEEYQRIKNGIEGLTQENKKLVLEYNGKDWVETKLEQPLDYVALSINIPTEPIPLDKPLIDEDKTIKEQPNSKEIFIPELSKKEIEDYNIFIETKIHSNSTIILSEEELKKYYEIEFLLFFYEMKGLPLDQANIIKKLKNDIKNERYIDIVSKSFYVDKKRIIQELYLSKSKIIKIATEKYIRALISNFKKLIEKKLNKNNNEDKNISEKIKILKLNNKKEIIKLLTSYNSWEDFSEKEQEELLNLVSDKDLESSELDIDEGKIKLKKYFNLIIKYQKEKVKEKQKPLEIKKDKQEISPNKKYYENLNKNIKILIRDENNKDVDNGSVINKAIEAGKDIIKDEKQLSLFKDNEINNVNIKTIEKITNDTEISLVKSSSIIKDIPEVLSSNLTNEIAGKLREAKLYIERFEKALSDAENNVEKEKANIGLLKFNDSSPDKLVEAYIELEKAEKEFNRLYDMKKEAFRLLKEEKVEPVKIKDLVKEDFKDLLVDAFIGDDNRQPLAIGEIENTIKLKNRIIKEGLEYRKTRIKNDLELTEPRQERLISFENTFKQLLSYDDVIDISIIEKLKNIKEEVIKEPYEEETFKEIITENNESNIEVENYIAWKKKQTDISNSLEKEIIKHERYFKYLGKEISINIIEDKINKILKLLNYNNKVYIFKGYKDKDMYLQLYMAYDSKNVKYNISELEKRAPIDCIIEALNKITDLDRVDLSRALNTVDKDFIKLFVPEQPIYVPETFTYLGKEIKIDELEKRMNKALYSLKEYDDEDTLEEYKNMKYSLSIKIENNELNIISKLKKGLIISLSDLARPDKSYIFSSHNKSFIEMLEYYLCRTLNNLTDFEDEIVIRKALNENKVLDLFIDKNNE